MTIRHTIIKRDRVQLESVRRVPTASQLASGNDGGCAPQKGVRMVEVAGRVQAIELTCSCGERTVIELDYENGASEAHSA
ncbi:MAG: hypothetical protein H6831_11480 [Planctomycetes bacterium]|nr:hypothetical protein [Planctomycetota bacterium]MCB9905021.1 hypothetical protein [Planctomycetota bacterium]